ncbi:MAG: hypothetical protein GY858_01025 [Candidatus Omnitrophica bacterium]|nr:hypothetical protein [Candidatus Omnitrophota bacterium]
MKTIAVIGATLTGNKGAASMLISLAQNRNQFCPEGCLIDCLTIYYQEDKKFNFYDDLNIIKCTPFDIICIAMPLSALYYLFSWITPIKNILLKNKVLRIVSKADLVVNIAGISYSDGRGLILLYNIACDIVPILLRKKKF